MKGIGMHKEFKYLAMSVLMVGHACLSGCSWMGVGHSDFSSCPGGSSDGVTCHSAREVYKMTDNADSVRGDKDGVAIEGGNGGTAGAANDPAQHPVAVPSIGQPLPIRTQPVVMRIWVAPWEDDGGDLHADGYIYTEIEDRRWNLGGRYKGPQRSFAPLVSIGPDHPRNR